MNYYPSWSFQNRRRLFYNNQLLYRKWSHPLMYTPHIDPAPKDKSVLFPLPEMNYAMDASTAASSVLTAVSEGVTLTPIEGFTCYEAYR